MNMPYTIKPPSCNFYMNSHLFNATCGGPGWLNELGGWIT